MEKIVPKGAWLTVNQRCNLRCKWCYALATGYQKNNEMTFDFAKEITRIIHGLNIKSIIILGGEPTLWEPLCSFNKFCRELKITTTLVTNGLMFGDNNFWEKYILFPNDRIGISLKAGNQKQMFKTTKSRKFRTLEKGVFRAMQHFDNCGVSITYNSFYSDNLLEIVKFAINCGARSVKIDFCSTVFITNQPFSKYMVEPSILVANIVRDYPELERITDGHIVFEMNLPLCIWPEDFIEKLLREKRIITVCQLLKREGIIFGTDGRLQLCNALFDYPIGRYPQDFHDSATLLDFLNTRRVISWYNRITRYPSLKCKNCDRYPICGGGCPLRWAVDNPEKIIKGRVLERR